MRKQKRLIKLVAVTLMIALMVPMAAFASVQELTFDTTKKVSPCRQIPRL